MDFLLIIRKMQSNCVHRLGKKILDLVLTGFFFQPWQMRDFNEPFFLPLQIITLAQSLEK